MVKLVTPLADQIRPRHLKDFIGQAHLLGKNGLIKGLIKADKIPSMIFWGPPGSGKTSLAMIIAQTTKSHFLNYSAVTTTLSDIRKAVKAAEERQRYGQKTILFLDEIHRFNKAQQDAFLPPVEKGLITLIGATTENPSFEIISPLLSRARVFVLKPLASQDLKKIIDRGLAKLGGKIKKSAQRFLLLGSGGDARIALNALEIAFSISQKKAIDLALLKKVFQKKNLLYDRAGEEHYNTISAFIKSMRASDLNAALYYLARMVEAGEDPLFIARRMVIFASEDIGLIQPTALVVANAVFRACEIIGYPECQINLAHGALYLAKCPKNRASYEAYFRALGDAKKYGSLAIPLKLLNAPTKLMKALGYGKDYEMYPKTKSLLPEKLKGKQYYK